MPDIYILNYEYINDDHLLKENYFLFTSFKSFEINCKDVLTTDLDIQSIKMYGIDFSYNQIKRYKFNIINNKIVIEDDN